MIRHSTESLSELYETDEAAWLDTMAELILDGRVGDLDYPHLAEYLADMARSERREVANRLAVLIAHALKWIHQPEKRSSSWRRSVVVQRQRLVRLFQSRVLRNHADAVLQEAYADGVEQAIAETQLDEGTFAKDCPFTVDELLSPEVLEE